MHHMISICKGINSRFLNNTMNAISLGSENFFASKTFSPPLPFPLPTKMMTGPLPLALRARASCGLESAHVLF